MKCTQKLAALTLQLLENLKLFPNGRFLKMYLVPRFSSHPVDYQSVTLISNTLIGEEKDEREPPCASGEGGSIWNVHFGKVW